MMISLICILIIAGLIIMFLSANYLYKKTTYYKNISEFDNVLDKDKPIPKNLDIVNFGSVHCRFAFEYEEDEDMDIILQCLRNHCHTTAEY